uniref:IS1106 ORF2 n=1 Tax=Neisseria meningitidis TaxID=487 RepID=Q51174_NEIME|nr:IS1106 ORF2 [Neisseria meningitidis]
MALRTHFNQPEIGCPRIAEFTVQRTEALFDHITGLRQISVAFGLRFRQRTVAAGFAHNAVLQLMFFQMLPVFRTVIAFVGIDGRTFGQSFQQRRQVFALMGIGGGNVQFLGIAFRIGTGMLFVTEFVEAVFLYPTGIFVLTRCGLAADLSFFIDFYGLTLFAAGGLNNGGVNDSGGCFLYF